MEEDSQLAASRVCSLEAAQAKDPQPGGHLPPAPLQQLPPAGRGVPCCRGVGRAGGAGGAARHDVAHGAVLRLLAHPEGRQAGVLHLLELLAGGLGVTGRTEPLGRRGHVGRSAPAGAGRGTVRPQGKTLGVLVLDGLVCGLAGVQQREVGRVVGDGAGRGDGRGAVCQGVVISCGVRGHINLETAVKTGGVASQGDEEVGAGVCERVVLDTFLFYQLLESVSSGFLVAKGRNLISLKLQC